MRINLVLFFLAVIALMFAIYVFSQAAMGSGKIPLEVSLIEPANHKIVGLSYIPLSDRNIATSLNEGFEPDESIFENVIWKSGQPFIAKIPKSSHTYGIGLEFNYYQAPLLLLRLEFDDGSTQYQVVEVPDLREKRSMTVTIDPQSKGAST